MRIIDLATGFSSASAPSVTGSVVKNNYAATSAPTANEDSGDGYEVGSKWINITSNYAYICVDATLTAAIWRRFDMIPLKIIASYTLDFSSTNVADSAWVTLTASTSALIKSLQVFYPDGDALRIATGAAASEVLLGYVFPGGTGTDIACDIAASTRLSIRLISGGTINTEGIIIVNAYGEA